MDCSNFGIGRKLDELCKQYICFISAVHLTPKKHAFKLYFQVFGYFFFAMSPLTSMETYCFQILYKFDKLSLNTERTEISYVKCSYCIIYLAFET